MRYAGDAPNLIKPRWEEEKQIRTLEKQEFAKEILRGENILSIATHADVSIDSTLGTPAFTNSTNSAQPSEATSMGAPPKSLPAVPASYQDYEVEEVDDMVAAQRR
jgi:hypothetical protein